MTKIMFNALLLMVLLFACNFNGTRKDIKTHIEAYEGPTDGITPDKTQPIDAELLVKADSQIEASTVQAPDWSDNSAPEILNEESSAAESTKDTEHINVNSPLEDFDNTKDEEEENINIKEKVENFEDDVKNTSTGKIDHSIFDRILKSFVKYGKVDYKGIKADKTLDNYLKYLASNSVEDGWTKEDKLAYWINAYNAFTIKLIIDNYPLKSITELHNGKPWDVKWIKLGGQSYSLNQIENEIIRPQFNEPRIHFAVNCAALSCPPLANEAYTAENLDGLLERQTTSFINNRSFNQIKKDKITISKIFEWYAEDFNNIISFLNQYSKTQINSNASVSYNDYNWDLNSL